MTKEMGLEEFKKVNQEIVEKDEAFRQEYRNLRKEQEKYGERYKPISRRLKTGKFCPNCGKKLSKTRTLYHAGSFERACILFCQSCGYKYAIN